MYLIPTIQVADASVCLAHRHLKRAGLDYWHSVRLMVHDDWRAFQHSDTMSAIDGSRWFFFSTKATRCLTKAEFSPAHLDHEPCKQPQLHQLQHHQVKQASTAVLVFGSETAGLYELLSPEYMKDKTAYRLPMLTSSSSSSEHAGAAAIRSYNLSTSVGIGMFEAYRQISLGLDRLRLDSNDQQQR